MAWFVRPSAMSCRTSSSRGVSRPSGSSRRTRDTSEVSVDWQIDAYRFSLPILAAPMDSVMSPNTAIALGRHGGLGAADDARVLARMEQIVVDRFLQSRAGLLAQLGELLLNGVLAHA